MHERTDYCAGERGVFLLLFLVQDDVPADKKELVAQVALFIRELEVVHGPAALGFRQIGDKIIVIGRRHCLFHDNLRLILVQFEDDILGLLSEFQCLEHLQTFRVYAYAGRLGKHYI